MVECFPNGTYQLAYLGMLHASRMDGLCLKIYHANLMMVKKNNKLYEDVVLVKNATFFG